MLRQNDTPKENAFFLVDLINANGTYGKTWSYAKYDHNTFVFHQHGLMEREQSIIDNFANYIFRIAGRFICLEVTKPARGPSENRMYFIDYEKNVENELRLEILPEGVLKAIAQIQVYFQNYPSDHLEQFRLTSRITTEVQAGERSH